MSIRTYAGAVCVITGGASGIGRALGEELARRGATEVVLADIQGTLAEEAAAKIRASGAKATAVTLDVRDAAAVERMFADVEKRHGRLDYVFNNAGAGVFGEEHLCEARDWDFLIDLNIKGVVNVIRAAYPRMIRQGFGHMVNTASVAGLMTTPFLSIYSATKHAVVGMSKAMRVEAARHGVRVTALCPGAIKTPILEGGAFGRTVYDMTAARMLQWWAKMSPMPVEPFAKKVLDLVAKNERIIVLPKQTASMLRLLRLFPALEEKIATKLFEITLAKYPEVAKGKKPAEPTAKETGATA
jgi:NAD(P)-dependent dehydrogenase (short-subunit alcohol dehydrogenase family)